MQNKYFFRVSKVSIAHIKMFVNTKNYLKIAKNKIMIIPSIILYFPNTLKS